MRIRLAVAPLAVSAVLAGCAASAPPPRNEPDRAVVTSDQIIRTSAGTGARARLDAPAAQVFSALAETYLELGVDTKLVDTGSRRVGNLDFFMSRRLGGQPLSQYVSCGDAVHGGPVADQYRVYMSLVSSVTAAPDGTSELETAFQASALDQRGVSADRISCGTTGRLEERIRRTVATKLGVSVR